MLPWRPEAGRTGWLAWLEALRPLLMKADSFLARDAGDLPDLTLLVHADPEGRLNAAAVKEERG